MTIVALEENRRDERERLVQAVANNAKVNDPRILAAFRAVPREAFVPADLAEHAYEDRALPIGEGQTISQPSMIALMLVALAPRPTDRALEVGAGSGYAAALLSELVGSVLAVEIVPELAGRASRTLAALKVRNVEVERANGARDLPGRGPFDVILVSAGAREVPDALVRQLAPGGRIAIPVAHGDGQYLFVGRREQGGALGWEQHTPCLFVPLVDDP